jgi:hypothetical protein
MNTRHNLKEPYFQTNTPLLDEDFDLFAPEVIDLALFHRDLPNPDGYIMGFGGAQTR